MSVDQRRARLVRRHHLAGDAAGPEAVVEALIALHATDPASVYLSVLSRSRSSSLADVSAAMYGSRRLVRWMAMRRTLFVVSRADVPLIQAAVSADIAAALRRRLISRIERNGCEPPVDGDVGEWLAQVEIRVEAALARRGSATGVQLAADEPALATVIAAGAPSERPQRLTTTLLTTMACDGRIVRGDATGAWTTRQHRWEPVAGWWPDGLASVDPGPARVELARRWLERFGPARVEDLRWWTGWNQTTTRRALAGLEIEEVDLHGGPGISLADDGMDTVEAPGEGPVATLLPALDPTPMGFTHREWLFGIEPAQLFDRAGNIAPTLWVDGEIVGAWAVTAAGDVATAILADRGAEGERAVERAAAELHERLEGAVVQPAFRVPLERSLAGGDVHRPG